MKKRTRRFSLEGWGFALPALIVFIIFVILPVISVFVRSFMNWDGMGQATWCGFENYVEIFTSPEFWVAIINNLKFLIIGVPIWTIFPLVVAVLLHEEVKGWKFFRSAFFFPTVISGAVVASLFRSFFLYSGPVNEFLNRIGIESIDFFALPNVAIFLIILAVTWVGFGSTVLIFLAGMSNFSVEYFEAAELDGASWWQKFTKLTIPLLKPTLTFVIMLNIMAAFAGIFGYVFLMTGGGPGYSTTVVEYLLYTKAFKLHDFGYAAALSVVMFIIVVTIALIQSRVTKDKDHEDGALL